MSNLSLLLIIKNESENIKKWAEWLPKLTQVNELVVVDNGSSDNSANIIKNLKHKNLSVKIINGAGDGDFSTWRNLGLSHCTNKIILWLDADEQPDSAMIDFLNQKEIDMSTNYAFRRQDIFLGRKLAHGETANQYFLRLFSKSPGQFVGLVHEVWRSQIPVKNLEAAILHTPYNDFRKFIAKLNFYTDLRAQELFRSRAGVNLFLIIFYPLGKFIKTYIFQLGFLDGTAGIIFALSMSFHSFLVRAKLWTLLNP